MSYYKNLLKSMVFELENHSNITIDDVDFPKGASEEEINAALKFCEAKGIPHSQEMIEFYGEMNGFSLQWHSADDAHFGDIYILSIEDVFIEMDEDEKEEYEEVLEDYPKVLEMRNAILPFYSCEDGELSSAALYVSEGENKLKVVMHDGGYLIAPTGYSFKEFIELMTISYGHTAWSDLIFWSDEPGEVDEFSQETRTNIAGLFDNFDPDNKLAPNTMHGQISADE